MNLHLAINDRFIERFIHDVDRLGKLSGNYFVVYNRPDIPFEDNQHSAQVKVVSKLSDFSAAYRAMAPSITTIFIHFLTNDVISFLQQHDHAEKKLVWVFWGADGFSLPEIRTALQLDRYTTSAVRRVVRRVRGWVQPQELRVAEKKKFLGELDYVAHYLSTDIDLFKTYLKPSCQFQYFTYGVLENIVDDVTLTGNSILLGNSADPTNNHLHVLSQRIYDTVMNSIVCPLSYSGDQAYVNRVVEIGRKKFGDRFNPQLDVLRGSAYNQLLSQCSFAIMFHQRSQAWGNIMQLIWQGSKVWMCRESNLFRYLTDLGFVVLPLPKKLHANDLVPLTAAEVEQNRTLLKANFSFEALQKHYLHVLEL